MEGHVLHDLSLGTVLWNVSAIIVTMDVLTFQNTVWHHWQRVQKVSAECTRCLCVVNSRDLWYIWLVDSVIWLAVMWRLLGITGSEILPEPNIHSLNGHHGNNFIGCFRAFFSNNIWTRMFGLVFHCMLPFFFFFFFCDGMFLQDKGE